MEVADDEPEAALGHAGEERQPLRPALVANSLRMAGPSPSIAGAGRRSGGSAKVLILRRLPGTRAARDPKELVGPAPLLVSDAGSYITGQTIAVDGG